jgi:hypothetical protein
VGNNDRVLSERAIEPALYSDWPLTVELKETIHLHYRNWRPVVNKEQFLAITDAFARARKTYDELGRPEPCDEHGPGLSDTHLPPPLHQNRIALELCTDGTIHFHFDDMRLHIDKKTFVRLGLLFREGLQEYCKHNSTTVKLSEVGCASVVRNLYLPLLDEYVSSGETVDFDNFSDVFLEHKKCLRPEDEQRYSDGWLKNPDGTEFRARGVSNTEIDSKHLFALFESIKRYGYGKGPYKYDYIRATRDDSGKVYLTGAHRTACLIKLGYEDIPVIVTNT